MSTEVDRKVVELSFDNSKFEKNIKKSQQSLNQFKSDLDFKDSAKSISVLTSAIESITLKPLENSVATVRESFNLLYRTVDNVMDRIANKIVDTGKKYAEMFTVAPITAGFEEYETQMGAIQTILANTSSKGSTLDDVNKSLKELNKYADLTIYNFTEMTRNIGTFTAAGIDLETSTRAIQGIANLAAVSGSTSQQASTAMYQLSQALAAGALKLQDWNSVVNAGMGGEVFQNALKDTAKTYGIAVDEIIEKAGSFRESLKEGWITSEILTETLSKFTTSGVNEYLAKVTGTSLQTVEAMRKNALASSDVTEQYHKMAAELAKSGKISEDQAYQLLNMSTTAENAATKVKTFTQLIDTLTEAVGSGWTMTWQLIVGDFEEAKGFFTDISDMLSGVINDASDARNAIVNDAMTSNWSKFSSTLQDAGLSVDTFRQKLVDDARKSGLAIDKWIEIDGSFEATLQRGWLTDDRLLNTLDGFAGKLDGTGTEAAAAAQKIASYQSVVNAVIQGVYGDGSARVKSLTDAGYEYSVVQDLVNRTIAGEKINYDELSNAQLKNLGLTDDQIQAYKALAEEARTSGTTLNEMIQNMSEKSGRQLLIESIKNTLTGILAIVKSVKIAFKQTFNTGAKPIKTFLTTLNKLTAAFAKVGYYSNELMRTFSGLFSLFGIVGDIAGGVLKFALEELGKVVDVDAGNILGFTASIGDNIVAFRKWMKEHNVIRSSLEKIRDAIANAWTYLGEFKDKIMETEVAQTVFAKIQAGAKNVGKFMNEHFGNAITLIKNFIQYVKSLGHIDISDLPKLFASFREMVVDELFKMEVDFTDFGTYLKSNLISSLQSSLAKVRGPLDSFLSEASIIVDAIKKTFSQLNWGVVFSAVNAFAVIKTVDKITNALTKAANSFAPVTGILNSVKGAVSAFSNVLKQQAFKTQAEATLEMAAAVGVLALSLTLLASIDPDKIGKALGLLGAMVVLMGSIGVLSVALTKVSGEAKVINNTTLTIIALGIAVNLLATACDKLAKTFKSLDMMGTTDVITGLGVMLGGIAAVIYYSGTVSKELNKAAGFMISIAASCVVLAGALKLLSSVKFVNPAVILELMSFIGVFALMAKSLTGKEIASFSVQMLAFSGSLLLIAAAFNNLPSATQVGKGMTIVVTFAGIVTAMIAVSKLAGRHANKIGVSILAFSASLGLLAVGIRMLGSIKTSEASKGIGVIWEFGFVAIALIAVSKLAGEASHKAGVLLLAFSGAVVALTAAVAAFSLMDPEGLKQGIQAVQSIGFVMTALIAVSKLAENAFKSLIVITTLLVGMTVGLGILSSSLFDQDAMIKAATALGIIMAALAASFAAIGLVSKAMANTKGVMGTMTVALIEMAGVMAAISTLVITISAIEKKFDLKTSLDTIQGISSMLLALSAAMVILGIAGMFNYGTLLAGVGGLVTLIAGLAGVVTLMGMLVEAIGDDGALIDTGIDALKKLFVGLGELFAESVVATISGLPEIGNILSEFMDNLQGFLDGCASLSVDRIEAIDSLITTLSTLFSGKFKIKKLEDNQKMMVKLSSSMALLTPVLNDFAEQCKSIDTSGLNKAKAGTEALVEMAGFIVNDLWAVQTLTDSPKDGNSDLTKFGTGLKSYGEALVEFSKQGTGIDSAGMEAGVNATDSLAEAAGSIPNTDGFLAAIVGDNTWNDFRDGLSQYARTLVVFSIACKHIDATGLENGVDATKKLAAVNDEIPETGGKLGEWFGDKSWSNFSAGLSSYATALQSFSIKSKSINATQMQNGVDGTAVLIDLYETLPEDDSWWDKLWGNTKVDWSKLGNGLNAYAESLMTFASTLSDGNVNFSAVNSALTSISKLINLASSIRDIGLASDNVNWTILQGNLQGLSTSFGYISGVTDAELTNLASTETAAETLTKIIQNVADSILNDDKSAGIKNFKTLLNSITFAASGFYTTMSSLDSGTLSGHISMVDSLVAMIKNAGSISDSDIKKYADIVSTFQQLTTASLIGGSDSAKTGKRKLKASLKQCRKEVNEYTKTTRKITRDAKKETETATAEVNASNAKAAAETEKESGNFLDTLVNTGKDKLTGIKDTTTNFFSALTTGDTTSIASMFGVGDLSGLITGDLSVAQSDITKYYKDLGVEYSSTLQTAKSEYDAIIEDYKDGRITQSEYDAKYTTLLKKYTQDQVGLIGYAQDKMSDYVQKNMDNLNKDFENTIKTIQSKIDKLKGNVNKDMADLMTFTTKNDLYEQGLEPLETRLQELNDQKDAAIARYGEESNQVIQLERNIKSLEKEITAYKEANESAKGDDTIVDARFTDKIRRGTTAINEYNDKLKELQKRSGSDALMSLFEGMDVEKGTATANYLLSETDEQLAALAHNYEKYQNAGDELAKTLYGDQLQSATETYVQDVLDIVKDLPDSAKTIGINIAAGLANGFSDETEASLSLIDMSGAKITDSIKELFGIHSPSTVMRDEVGRYLARGLIEGFTDELNKFANGIGNYISTDLGILDVNTQTSIDTMNNIISKLNAAIQNGINTSPVITPVLDLSQVQLGMGQLNTMFGAGGLAVPNTLINSTANINANDAALLGAVNHMNTDICGKLDTINPVSELMQLRNDVNVQFTTINDRLDNMQVVMDTGALVGQLTSGIDQSLGDRATMRRRGG
nr:MAG TPA: tail tape measure [Caudoviricetes sp.]